jgi:hypothetical protein
MLGPFDNFSTTPSSNAYPLANLALFVPISVPVPVVVLEGWVQAGATAGGNFDIGVYDESGNRLTSSGATARVVSSHNDTTTMGNLTLLPDRVYYMAFAADGTNNYFSMIPAAGLCEGFGILEATSAYVLPSSVTYVKTTRAYVPNFGLNMGTVDF